jgi:DNA polymerase I-like protein with 3'-5' exonuclease and polymerase domains
MQPQFDTYIVDSEDALDALKLHWLGTEGATLFLDLETNSANERKADIYGIGMCFNSTEAFYIPIRNNKTEILWKDLDVIYGWIASLCQVNKLINHNIIYDVLVFEYNSGYDISQYIYSDTILMKHMIDENRPFGLKDVAVKYLGAWADKAQKALHDNIKANGGSATKENMEMWKADTDILGEYCCYDVLLTSLLYSLFSDILKKQNLESLFYDEEVMPLYKWVTIPMKRRGFPVDVTYFEKLKDTITVELNNLENVIQASLPDEAQAFIKSILDKKAPIKRTGNFPKFLVKQYGLSLPIRKGKETLARNAIAEKNRQEPHWVWSWILGNEHNVQGELELLQAEYFFSMHPDQRFVFNLNSNDHLGWLFFEHFMETPLSKTDGGDNQCDDKFLDSIKDNHLIVALLIDYKKLKKLSSTYIEGVLERHIDGVIYTSLLQFGTTSGRYSSTDPNLQNIPRVKDDEAELSPLVLHYTNAIKRGFVSPVGYRIVNADYSQLEPRAFAEASGDKLLQAAFQRGEDLYGSIAVNVWNLDCKPNEVKKKYPEYRQKAKVIALAVVYGAEAGRISKLMNIPFMEAQEIIDSYLDSYPGLRLYMKKCDDAVCKDGYIATKFGRIRHIPEAKGIYKLHGYKLLDKRWAKHNGKDELRWKFKNFLNNSKNFPIQGVAAHTVNRAAIAIAKRFKECKIDGGLVMQVHDELTSIVREDQAEEAAKIVKYCMETTTKLSVPLIADPVIATNWADSK